MVRLALVVAVSTAVLGLASWAATSALSGSEPPPRQPTAEEFGVADENGDPIICANGKPLTVTRKDLLRPPDLPPGQSARAERAKERVPRCGPGGAVVWMDITR